MNAQIENRNQVANLLTDEFILSYTKVANRENLVSIDELIDSVYRISINNSGNEADAIELFNIQHDNYQDEIPSL